MTLSSSSRWSALPSPCSATLGCGSISLLSLLPLRDPFSHFGTVVSRGFLIGAVYSRVHQPQKGREGYLNGSKRLEQHIPILLLLKKFGEGGWQSLRIKQEVKETHNSFYYCFLFLNTLLGAKVLMSHVIFLDRLLLIFCTLKYMCHVQIVTLPFALPH